MSITKQAVIIGAVRAFRKTSLLTVIAVGSITFLFAQTPYTRDEIIKVSGVTSGSGVDALNAAQKQTSFSYNDGMGRVIQTVGMQLSPQQHDIISVEKYDVMSRKVKTYLPYAGSSGNGSFRSSATAEQASFYLNGTSDKVADDSSPYLQQVFDNSPLQLLLQQGAAGEGYQPGQHYRALAYRSNVSTDNVIRWNPDGTRNTYYPDHSLAVNESTDEGNNKTITFADMTGRVVLKRQLADETINSLTYTYFDTYYVYNDAGGLNYVIPPKATSLIVDNSYTISQVDVDKLLFKYSYDDKGRPTQKTVPGGAATYTVYDPLDRPLLIQDSKLRAANQWNYTKYDSKGRAISQGIYTDNTHTSLSSMQSYVNSIDYGTTYFESRNGDAATGYYSNQIFPTTAIDPLTYSYFDDYDLNTDGAPDYTYQSQGLTGEGAATYRVKGMLTAVRKKTVGPGLTPVWLIDLMFYDRFGNLIQTRGNNHLNPSVDDSQTQVPDFTGKPVYQKTVKSTTFAVTVLTSYSYDHAGRTTAVDQSYNGGSAIRVAGYEYNELGQLIDKKLHSTDGGSSYIQSVDFRYTIRGQLKSINNSKLSNDGSISNDDTNDVFGLDLLYDQADSIGNTSYYTGMLSAVKWMSVDGTGQKGQQRSYTYVYDKLLRLKDAIYADRPSSGGSWGNLGGYDEKNITYDQNGNITALKRNALIGSVATAIDDLQYTYDGNRLKNVTDGTGGSYAGMGFKNLAGSSADYTYSDDGHLTDDPKKGITTSVNLLQRSETVTITSATGRYLTYTYDAAGTLIRKQQFDNNTLQKTTDYLNGFVYENSTLAYFSVPEGRVRNAAGTFINEYIVTDQQGNTRVTFENNGGTARVIQENSYYPFGLVMSGSTVALSSTPVKKLYNGGSEWQNDFADLPDLMQTFYRDYDAALGRWTGVDPDAGATESISTYHYAGNNPVMINDPLGNEYTRNTESWDRFTHTPRYSADWVDINSWQVQMGYNPRYDEDTIEAYIKKNGTVVYDSKTDNASDLTSVFSSLGALNSSQYDENYQSSKYPVGLKDFVAIAAGEAAGSRIDARNIASTMINRIIAAKSSLNDPNWMSASVRKTGLALGGTVRGNYQILQHPKQYEYAKVMSMTIDEIMSSDLPYIQGALQAYKDWGVIDYSKGAYKWSATPLSPAARKKDQNFQALDRGELYITTIGRNTTYFGFK